MTPLDDNQLDAIVFTSKSQVHRLFAAVEKAGKTDVLKSGLACTEVAAVGPIVADLLREHGCEVQIMPQERYFMKPLTNALCERFERGAHTAGGG